MQRTISAMVGKGSVNHNSRKFKAENVNGDRTQFNIDYCNDNIKQVYHELFDDALKRYNDKQTRADRKIENYYDKIRNSKQEKPFHEIILQIGDKDNMSAECDNGELAKQVLDEYFKSFQERNPNLKVFSAHLHMDEATPHLHIDFVPYTIGSKRGLETRVSLKQALAALGFEGGTRRNTEWAQWVQSEKEQLYSKRGQRLKKYNINQLYAKRKLLMKSLGIAIKKGEIWYSFIEGTDRNVAIISETGKQNYRPESNMLMMDFNNIFTELITKFTPDVVSYKLSLDINMKQIPYMHYSIGVLNLLCLQKGVAINECSSRWITANKRSKIQLFEQHFPNCSYKNEELASSVIAWFAFGE